jgi:hypothetical protein
MHWGYERYVTLAGAAEHFAVFVEHADKGQWIPDGHSLYEKKACMDYSIFQVLIE